MSSSILHTSSWCYPLTPPPVLSGARNPASPRSSDTTHAVPILAGTPEVQNESSSEEREVVMLTQRLLNVIGEKDFQEYR